MFVVCLSNSGLYITGYGLYFAGTFGIARELLRHGYILGLLWLGLWFERDTSLLSTGQIKKGFGFFPGDLSFAILTDWIRVPSPLFGDAGTATALEYQVGYEPVRFYFSTDGSGYEAIIIRDGGYRHPFDNQSLDVYTTPEGLRRTRLNTEMDGMSVFSFGITKAPQSFNLLMERFSLDRDPWIIL